MITGSDAIIMDYSDARNLYEVLQGVFIHSENSMNEDEKESFIKFQKAVREIESIKFGDHD
jgi:hypothetical protein